MLLLLSTNCDLAVHSQFPEAKFPNNLPQDILSLRKDKLSLYFPSPLRRGRKFTIFWGNVVFALPKKVIVV